jgi:large subunit ribosomal protein L10
LNRDEKAAAIAELTEDLKGAEAVFAVDYRGISVTDAAELRTKLRDADATFKVVKNRLAKRATADAGTEAIDELLVGPTALTLIKGDAVVAAKAIADFAKEHEELAYKGGLMDGEALDPEGFKVIARLPGLDVLRGQLVGMAASPLTGLVAGLGNMISGLGRQLAQMAEQGLVTGEAPAAPAEEAPAEEAPAEEARAEEPAADSGTPAGEAEDVAARNLDEEPEAPEETDPAAGEDAPAAEADDETPEEVEAAGEASDGDEEE